MKLQNEHVNVVRNYEHETDAYKYNITAMHINDSLRRVDFNVIKLIEEQIPDAEGNSMTQKGEQHVGQIVLDNNTKSMNLPITENIGVHAVIFEEFLASIAPKAEATESVSATEAETTSTTKSSKK